MRLWVAACATAALPAAESHSDRPPRLLTAGSGASGGGEAQRLRSALLEGYDQGSYPWEEAWNASHASSSGEGSSDLGDETVRTGLAVEVGINFHRVLDVDEVSSAVDLLVWFRQRWVDPRLAWDPEEYGGLTTVTFWIGEGTGPGGETSEIWTPDLELWNMEEGLARSLVDAQASVDHTGKVWWSRPGHLRPVCKFKGLDAFPFDTLACSMEIGSWSMSGMYLRPVKMEEGFSVGGSETAGEAFAAYRLGSVSCREHVYPPYPGDPENDWPVLFYDLAFERAWQPYARGYIMLQIVLNLAAFACFWLPPQCGERMTLAITAMLAAVASELVVSEGLPAASEVTWVAKFSITSLMFSAAALFESAAVMYFFYHTGDDLIPGWVKWLRREARRRRDERRATRAGTGTGTPSEENRCGSHSGDEPELSRVDSEDIFEDDKPLPNWPEPTTHRIQFKEHLKKASLDHEESEPDCARPLEVSIDDSGGARRDGTAPVQNGARSFARGPGGGFGLRGSFAREPSFARDADDYKSAREAKNNMRWQLVARRIDDFSRMFFPLVFAVSLAGLLGPS